LNSYTQGGYWQKVKCLVIYNYKTKIKKMKKIILTDQEKAIRKKFILQKIAERYTYEEIGKILGLTKQRVYQLIADENVKTLRYSKKLKKQEWRKSKKG